MPLIVDKTLSFLVFSEILKIFIFDMLPAIEFERQYQYSVARFCGHMYEDMFARKKIEFEQKIKN